MTSATSPFCTTATARPGIFHSSIASAMRSSSAGMKCGLVRYARPRGIGIPGVAHTGWPCHLSDGDGRQGRPCDRPLIPRAEWPDVRDFAHPFAQAVAGTHPDRFTVALSKAKRNGRIFVDYLRNQRGATAVMPYSVRARPGAPVAAPLSWEELRGLDSPAHWRVGDARALVKRLPQLCAGGDASTRRCRIDDGKRLGNEGVMRVQ